MTTPPNRVAESGALAPPPPTFVPLSPTIPALPIGLPFSGPYAGVFSFAGEVLAGQHVRMAVQASIANADINPHGLAAQIQTSANLSNASIDYGGGIEIAAGATLMFPIIYDFTATADGPFTIDVGFNADGGGPSAVAPCSGFAFVTD